MKRFFTAILSASAVAVSATAGLVANYAMDVRQGKITETVSGTNFVVNGVHDAEDAPGASGRALRFDGYSTFVDAQIANVVSAGTEKMTASVCFAIETYPIVEIDVNTTEQVAIATCVDETAKTGFGFFLGFDGKYSFKTYIGGWPVELKVDTPLPQYEWINLTAVLDAEARTLTLYNNGSAVAKSRANGGATVGASKMRIGRSMTERMSGPFCLTSFNGLIDDISVWDEALAESTIASWKAENEVDMTVSPERFAGDPMRPAFHGMPGANWTNETHGMTYSNGRYHVFFQKNANGPYMSRLHWGHISSENLYDWREEHIALTPGAYFDIKGCWSGCVFTDDVITGGRPGIIYTGVDYAKAVIAKAEPKADDLIEWTKSSMPIINGRPSGLSDDFRDPYFFRNGDNAYIIVGSSKGGVGTTTLHAYSPTSKTWSNDGRTFFTGTDAASCGTFWEMPNITKIGDKWIFTATPQRTARGVAALYWTGTINADGTFKPDRTAPANIELPGFARDGYGLLSPTIFQHDGKTIVMGIVPDKLAWQANYDLGYAHTYSLPREWTIDTDGSLVQRPYSGLTAMRKAGGFEKTGFDLSDRLVLDGVTGRAVEVCAEFTVSAGKCGFRFLDDGTNAVQVYYDGATGEVVVDARGVDRLINDSRVFDGYYHSTLPRPVAKGEAMKLNVFFDHSILDIFINDRYATSVRVFAMARAEENVSFFADASTTVSRVNAWNLDAKAGSGAVDNVVNNENDIKVYGMAGTVYYNGIDEESTIALYDIAGAKKLETTVTDPFGSVETGLTGLHLVTVVSNGRINAKKIVL